MAVRYLAVGVPRFAAVFLPITTGERTCEMLKRQASKWKFPVEVSGKKRRTATYLLTIKL